MAIANNSGIRPLVLTPTKLTTFQRCPQQYYLRYVVRSQSSEPLSLALVRGNAAHDVLAQAFTKFQNERAFPVNLRDRVGARLPRQSYEDSRHWEEDVELVVEWVHSALNWFDGSADILCVERQFDRRVNESEESPSFVLRAKTDLLLERPDGNLEIVDWKTSSNGRIDMMQNVATRILVGKQDVYRGRKVHNTVVFLPTSDVHSEMIGREVIIEIGAEIKRLAREIATDSEWEPVANPLCDYCPFINTCSLYAANGEVDDWLDDVA